MKIGEIITKKAGEGKSALESLENELFIGAVILLVGSLGFGIGRLSHLIDTRDLAQVVVRRGTLPEQTAKPSPAVHADPAGTVSAAVVASKNGKRYYYPWCSGASRLSPKTKITFSDPAAAEKAGFTIASGCAAR